MTRIKQLIISLIIFTFLTSLLFGFTSLKYDQHQHMRQVAQNQPAETGEHTRDTPAEMSLHYIYKLVEQEMEKQQSVVDLLLQPVINHHNFTYIHNPEKVCKLSQIDVLFVIPSATENFENRAKVRNGSRASFVGNKENHSKLLFFLGEQQNKDNKTQVQVKIDEEFSKYGDIVQDGFEDAYKNIRLKAVSMLKWVVTYCDEVKFVIRTDDDVKVDPKKLVEVLQKKSVEFKDFIIGNKAEKWEPIRHKSSKYALSKEEYPYATLPPFVLGGLLGYPMRTVKLLYQAALRVKPVWLDDVYITGICAAKVNVPILQDPDFVFQHWAW